MQKLLVKLFIKDYQNIKDSNVRTSYGSLAGIVGIVSNLILAALKIILGIIAASPAISADGINNLSDSLSSIITLIGFKLSNKKADADHPFGHQRFEYITGLIISFVILAIGLILGYNSILGVISLIKGEPAELNVDQPIVVIGCLVLSILIKFWQSSFYKKMGKTIDSQALYANSKDSLNDCITTAAVLVSTILYIVTDHYVNIDSIAGLVVAGFIIISSVGLIKETVDPLLGVVPTDEDVKKIADFILNHEGVYGIHDLVIHSYGPNMNYVTCHVEVSREVDVMESHDMIDNIEQEARKNLGLDLTIHMDPIEIHDKNTIQLKEMVKSILLEIDPVLNFHDFRIVPGPTHTNILFDVVIPAVYKMTPKELRELIQSKVTEINPNYFTVIQVDQFYNRITND